MAKVNGSELSIKSLVLDIIIKESYSTTNESKRQYNRFIIYYLNFVPIVNDSFLEI